MATVIEQSGGGTGPCSRRHWKEEVGFLTVVISNDEGREKNTPHVRVAARGL